MPAIRPPPPIGTTSTSSSGASASISSAERALARDDRRVVEGMDEGEVALGGKPMRIGRGLVHALALEHDPGAELRGVLDLHERRQRGITMVAGMPRRRAW